MTRACRKVRIDSILHSMLKQRNGSALAQQVVHSRSTHTYAYTTSSNVRKKKKKQFN